MFDIGWSEMAIIMLVAIIIIGPKDLPRVARTIGQWTGKARAMAREFHRSLDDMAREAELDDIKKSIEKAGSSNSISKAITESVDPDGELERAFDVSDKPKPAIAAPAPSHGKEETASGSPAEDQPKPEKTTSSDPVKTA